MIEADEVERMVMGRTCMGGGVLDLRSGKSLIIPSPASSTWAKRGDKVSISANEYVSRFIGSAGPLPVVVSADSVGTWS